MDKVKFIKEVIEKYGDFAPYEVGCEPIIYKKLYGNYFDSEEMYLYKNLDDDTVSETIKYEDTPVEILDKIYEIVVKWNEFT